jgi:hypothetical protein
VDSAGKSWAVYGNILEVKMFSGCRTEELGCLRKDLRGKMFSGCYMEELSEETSEVKMLAGDAWKNCDV